MSVPKNPRKPKTINDQNAISLIDQFGKMPPQAVDLEEAVLGAVMIEKDAMDRIAEILTPQAFYLEAHQTIYGVFQVLFERAQPIDIITVTQELRRGGQLEQVGGAFYVTKLTNRVGSAAHIEYHSRLIAQKHIQRELIRVSTEIQKEAFEESNDVFELLDDAEKKLFAIAEGNISKQYDKIDNLLVKAIKQIEAIKEHKDGLSGVPSGFSSLDRLTSGWQPNNLIIVAARPGMGKTAFALSAARNAAILGKKGVAIFSLEMESVELVTRLISGEAMIPGSKLKSGKLEPFEWEQLNVKVHQLGESRLFIDDTAALSVFQLRAKCRRLKAQHNIDMVVVDYLQLMKGDESNKAGNREQEISYISRSLKALAKELGIPIMALAQLNREADKRGGSKSPMLSDLRESGSIEQDADMVIFINRPEYYGITEDAEGNSLAGVAEIIIAKHRNGATDKVLVRFLSEYAKFADMDPMDHYFQPEVSIDQSVTITRSSKMNTEFEDDPF
jgi:replicative DNA helicase